MARQIGTFVRDYNNEVVARAPFDARLLVTDIADLTAEGTWVNPNTSKSTAYNGMIVSVANTTETSSNGIYYFFDPSYSKLKGGSTTNSENWYKLCDLSELDTLESRIADLEAKTPEINYEELIAQLKEQLVSLEDYNTYKEETDTAIAALQTSTQNNTNAIAALVGEDTNLSVREIIDATVSETKVNDESYNGIAALATQVLNNSSAIAALTNLTEEQVEEIAINAITQEVKTSGNYDSIAALVGQVVSNTDAIAALTAVPTEDEIGDIAIQAVEAKVQETNSAYTDIAALVSAVTVAKSHADNAQTVLDALIGSSSNAGKSVVDLVDEEIAKSGSNQNISSIAALTTQSINNASSIQALVSDLNNKVVDALKEVPLNSLIQNSGEILVDPNNPNQLTIGFIELSKIIHTDTNTTIVIHGGNAG